MTHRPLNPVAPRPDPKIELHVHLEGTIRPSTLLSIAKRNDLPLPTSSVEGLEELYKFKNFAHFIDVWILTTNVLRRADDFRQVVVDYAKEATSHGAVYLEGIFSPAERVKRGVSWDALFEGYCDGVEEAYERYGLIVCLTPDIYRGASEEEAHEVVRRSLSYADRGVVGVGLGGLELEFPPEPYASAFALAKQGGLGSVPHAGEAAGPESIWASLEVLHADRIRHGIRAVEDSDLMTELIDRRIVLDVCPTSNLRTGVVASLSEHPLPTLIEGGVLCSISTDDPAMFGTDLGSEYGLLSALGGSARAAYQAGVTGLCDETTRLALIEIGSSALWDEPLSTDSTSDWR